VLCAVSVSPPSAISQEKTIKNIEGFDPKNLKHTETTEKNSLPSPDGGYMCGHMLSLLCCDSISD
jgi:hypothetical protein